MMWNALADQVFDVGITLFIGIGPIGHQTAPEAPLIFFVVVRTRFLAGAGTCASHDVIQL